MNPCLYIRTSYPCQRFRVKSSSRENGETAKSDLGVLDNYDTHHPGARVGAHLARVRSQEDEVRGAIGEAVGAKT